MKSLVQFIKESNIDESCNASSCNVKVRKDLPQLTHGGDWKKDAAAHSKADRMLKQEGFTIGKDNLYHHKDGRIVRINHKTGYYEEINESNNQTNIVLDWSKSHENVDYKTKKLISAITDKYRNLLDKGSKPSFSDVAFDYLSDNGYDEDEATDLSYELEDTFNQIALIK